jgi:hypothetical protein
VDERPLGRRAGQRAADLWIRADAAFELLEPARFNEGRRRAQDTETGSVFWSEAGTSEERLALGVGFPAPTGTDRSIWRWGLAAPRRDFYVGTSAGPVSLAEGDMGGRPLSDRRRRGEFDRKGVARPPRGPRPFLVVVPDAGAELPLQFFCADPDSPSGSGSDCAVEATLSFRPDSVPLFMASAPDGSPEGLVSDIYYGVPHGPDGLEVWRWPEERLRFIGFTGRVEADPGCAISAEAAERAVPFVCNGTLD